MSGVRTMARRVVSLMLVVVLAGPVLAEAGRRKPIAPPDPPVLIAMAIMYEVAEHIRFLGGEMRAEHFRRRFANATLLGDSVLGFAEPFAGIKFADAQAQSFVSAKTGRGPIRGTFNLLEDFDPTTNLLSTLQVKVRGRITGTLDLSTVDLTATAPISGEWRFHGKRHSGGRFEGVFLVPFAFEDAGPIFYVDIDGGKSCRSSLVYPFGDMSLCVLDKSEFLLNIPLTKLVIFFYN